MQSGDSLHNPGIKRAHFDCKLISLENSGISFDAERYLNVLGCDYICGSEVTGLEYKHLLLEEN